MCVYPYVLYIIFIHIHTIWYACLYLHVIAHSRYYISDLSSNHNIHFRPVLVQCVPGENRPLKVRGILHFHTNPSQSGLFRTLQIQGAEIGR